MVATTTRAGFDPELDDTAGSLAILLAAFEEVLERAHALNQEAEKLLQRIAGGTGLPTAAQPTSHLGPERRRWRRD
jgi:hypothetical protein